MLINKILRKLLVVFLVSIFLLMFAGCDKRSNVDKVIKGIKNTKRISQDSAEDNEITFWMKKGLVEDTNKMIIQRGKEFAALYNVKVNVEIISYEDFLPKWISAIESGKTPDVSFLGYQEVGQFYEKGVLMDLSSLCEKIEAQNGCFYPSLKNAVTFEGKQYGIPFWAETMVMYYRKDLLKAAGFTDPPKTWDEYRKIAKAITDPAKGIYGAGIGYGKGNSDSEWFTRSVLWSFGGAEIDTDGKTVIVNSPESVNAMKFISDIFLLDKSTPPSAIGWDDSGNNKAYLSGQAVTVFNTGSITNAAKTDNPELYKNTGLAPFPAGPKGQFIPGIENTLGIFSNSNNPELAQKFIEFLMDIDWYSNWIDKSAPLLCPVYSQLEDNPIWQDPMNKPFIESVKNLTFLGYKGEFSSKAGEVYNLRLLNDTVQEMISSKLTPEKSMHNLKEKIEEIYKK
ncbi:sugar ABC transporter substrate-binding protein [Petroclostridium sp. X23]|uniref:ABC transporter substrate-binding protein n=1 Tax=Petroclostridium sp. X23 TaxID=3045146 RepID=UPI0024AD1052|nr:sugar ABC transporter substrate-binding protein [Petroclostridium sp. X23]WHH58543.1 sugar ABC transporter substrate-binding protein [Petroclostridium sp. X23]